MSLGPWCAFFSSITWAVGSTAYARVAATTAPSAINFTRALLALPLFLLVLASTSSGRSAFAAVTMGHVGWLFVSMLMTYVIGDVVFLLSCIRIGVPAALAIASAYPLWAALAGWVWLHEQLPLAKLAAVCAVVCGVVVVIVSGKRLERQPRYAQGIGLAIATSFFWALNTVTVARGGSGLDANMVNVVRMGIAIALCPWVGIYLTGRPTFLIPARDLRRYGALFLAEAYGGSFCFVYGMTHAPLAVAAALSSLAPVIATPLAWIARREPVSLIKFAGILLVVAGAYCLVT